MFLETVKDDQTYLNKNLMKRLLDLIYSRGLSELELCKKVGISYRSWDYLKRGVKKPSSNLLNEFMKVLGSEVQLLFMGYYITNDELIGLF